MTRHITHGGRTQTIAQWSAETGIHRRRLYARLRQGWSGENVFTPNPVRESPEGFRRTPHKWELEDERNKAAHMARVKAMRENRKPLPRDMWDVPLDEDPWAQAVIDVAAEEGGLTLDEVGLLMGGMVRERVRQIEEVALRKIRRYLKKQRREVLER